MDWMLALQVVGAVAALYGLVVLVMAVGVMFRRPCLRGSCGGTAVTGPGGERLSCDGCPNRRRKAGPA